LLILIQAKKHNAQTAVQFVSVKTLEDVTAIAKALTSSVQVQGVVQKPAAGAE